MGFVFALKRKNTDFLDLYFTFLEAIQIPPKFNINKNAKEEDNIKNAKAKYINENWCGYIAFVDKLWSQNNKIKCFLVAVDVFSRFVRVQTMKPKYAKDTL